MIASLLLLAVAVTPPAAASARQSPQDHLTDVALQVLERTPKVTWHRESALVGDVNNDGRPDVVILGTGPDVAFLGTVLAPITKGSKPVVLTFRKPVGAHPDPGALCGAPEELTIGFEPPGVKPSDLSCAAKQIDVACQKVLATELRLQKARGRGTTGVKLSGGKCAPLHLYFDLGRFWSWRQAAVAPAAAPDAPKP